MNAWNPYTLRACRRPSAFSPAESAPPAKFRDALSSLLQGAENGRDERRLRAVRRAARALRARSLGGWARGALWGYSEAIPNGNPWDPLGYAEAIPNGKLFRTNPNGTDGLFRGFTQTRKRRTECLRICLVGFGQI